MLYYMRNGKLYYRPELPTGDQNYEHQWTLVDYDMLVSLFMEQREQLKTTQMKLERLTDGVPLDYSRWMSHVPLNGGNRNEQK